MNCEGIMVSTWFSLKDGCKSKLESITRKINSNSYIGIEFNQESNQFKIYTDGCPLNYEDDPNEEMNQFYIDLQQILEPTSIVVFTEIATEGFRMVHGCVTVVTSKQIKSYSLYDAAIDIGREFLQDKDWLPDM